MVPEAGATSEVDHGGSFGFKEGVKLGLTGALGGELEEAFQICVVVRDVPIVFLNFDRILDKNEKRNREEERREIRS